MTSVVSESTSQANRVPLRGRVPLLLIEDRAHDFKDVHLAATIDVPEMQYSHASMSKFIICADDAEAFCRMWFYSDLTYNGLNNHLILRLHLRNPSPRAWSDRDVDLPKSLQRSLLAPFTQIKTLQKVEVGGTVNPEVKEDFLKEIAVPNDPPEVCLDRCSDFKDKGKAALKQGKYREAINLYEQAFGAMHIIVDGHRRFIWADPFFEKTLASGVFKDQNGSVVRMMMRIRLVANIIQAYLELEEYSEAKFWGRRSIDLMRQYLGNVADAPRPEFPGAREWGKIYYRTYIACKNLGEEVEARELIRIAADWLPNDPSVKTEKAVSLPRLL